MRLLTFLGCVLSLSALAQPEWETIQIPMSDGESLAADLYLPADGGEYPVIFIQTPYNKNAFHLGLPLGVGWSQEDSEYAFVVMDWRCYFESSDACVDNPNNGLDGYDAVEWIAEQKWCDGNIGTWGPSALGGVQFNTARNQPPHLVCCVPEVVAPQQRYQRLYPGGAAKLELIQQLGVLFGLEEVYASIPYYSLLWQIAEAETMYPEEIEVPMLLVGGWYDINCEDVVMMFDTLKALSPASEEIHMMMGPWVHGGNGPAFVGSETQGELSYPEATEMYSQHIWKYFDYHLRGIDNGWQNESAVNYFQTGGGSWHSSETWPPENIQDFPFYMHSNEELWPMIQSQGDLQLPYEYDSEDPSPTIGGQVLSLDQGPFDQSEEVESRDDNLIFSYATGLYPLEIKGTIKVNLFVSSDQIDTDFVVRLTDVYPDGKSYIISSTIQRMRFLNGFTENDEEMIIPGEVYEITLELPPLAYTFDAEHELRIIVSSSSYPHYNRNMNNGAEMYPGNDLDVLVNPNIATNTVYASMEYPSHVVLPLVDLVDFVQESEAPELHIWPNPAIDVLNVSASLPNQNWMVYDHQGRLVKQGISSGYQTRIDLDELRPGMYSITMGKNGSNSFIKH